MSVQFDEFDLPIVYLEHKYICLAAHIHCQMMMMKNRGGKNNTNIAKNDSVRAGCYENLPSSKVIMSDVSPTPFSMAGKIKMFAQ